ncbi:MAG: cytochrome P450 [Nitriliruptoraceae bacterium]|nr:cytochrome P450 [Nitriliruptoraceae bacterium]
MTPTGPDRTGSHRDATVEAVADRPPADGPMWDPFDEAHVADPFPIYRRMRDEFPVYRNERDGFYALSRFDDVASANADWETYSSAEGIDLDNTGSIFFGAGNMVEEDPPLHRQLRAVVRHHLTPALVASTEPSIAAKAERLGAGLAARLHDGDAVDVVAALCLPLPLDVVGSLMGLDPERQQYVHDRFLVMFARESGSASIPQAALDAAQDVRDLLHDQLEERRRTPREDLLTAIAHGELDDRPMLPEERIGLSTLVITAAISTTRNLLASIFWYAGRDDALRRRLVDDVAGHRGAIEEFLRYDSPIQNTARVTTRDVELHGVRIPEGAQVSLVFGAANRDERQFPDPDRLDLDRVVRRHYAFGGGIHTCIGAPLARLETRLALRHALPQLPAFACTGREHRALKFNERGFEMLEIATP